MSPLPYFVVGVVRGLQQIAGTCPVIPLTGEDLWDARWSSVVLLFLSTWRNYRVATKESIASPSRPNALKT